MSNYGYARVSTKKQHEDRQITALKATGISMKIYTDKYSGRTFDRPQWNKMIKRLRRGDCLYVLSIDRLGRNYDDIQTWWNYLTKEKGIDIIVIDMPLLDTRDKQDLSGMFLSDIVLKVLCYMAELERNNKIDRVEQGIKEAKKRGVQFGRKHVIEDEDFLKYYEKVKNKEVTMKQACKLMEISTASYYRYKDRLTIG